MNPNHPSLPKEFETERLLLTLVNPLQYHQVYERAIAVSRNEINQWIYWPTFYDARTSLTEMIQDFDLMRQWSFLILLKDTHEFLGVCQFHPTPETLAQGHLHWPETFEIGYWLSTEAQGHGYMTEAVYALTRYIFRQCRDAQRVEILVDERNTASRNVAQRCGFTLEGVLRSHHRDTSGNLANTCIYSRIHPSKFNPIE
jgi:ribosomal-protein-serine acetyltransferase